MPEPGATRVVRAHRAAVYRALLDRSSIERWRVPDGMTARVLAWEPVVGGTLRVTLTHDERPAGGKSSPGVDTYHGTFTELVADTRVVEVLEFETDDPDMAGPMTATTTLADVTGGCEVTIAYEGLPGGVSREDNAKGTSMALARLAALVEGG
ncbi:MAG TPA: SRPBCC domain-containing protein [Acidimicrobiales bacterium]